jgi:hypothetical protein
MSARTRIVTTPLSGFSGDGTRLCSPPLTPDGPVRAESASEDVASCVYVSISRVAARARMDAHSQRLRNDLTAGATCLTRVFWIDQDQLAASIFRFASEQLGEQAPALIVYVSGEDATSEPAHAEILYANGVVAAHEVTADLVGVVAASVGLTLALTGEEGCRLASAVRASPPTSHRALRSSHGLSRSAVRPRSRQHLAVARCGECRDAKVNSDATSRRRQRARPYVVECQRDVPTVRVPGDAALPESGAERDRAVHLDLDVAHALQPQPARIGESDPTMAKAPRERVEAARAPEARIAGPLASLQSSEERLEGAVETNQDRALRPGVDARVEQSSDSQILDLSLLLKDRHRDSMVAPHVPSMLKRCVVKLARFPELLLKGLCLIPRRVEPVAISAAHTLNYAKPDPDRRRRR